MIKISFSGISGSGKTALLTEVKKILSLKDKVCSIDDIFRKNPFDNDKRSSFVSQFFYISTQINEENTHSISQTDFLLCDRSVLDQWIYWKSHIHDKEMTPQLQEKNDILWKLYQFWMKTYDLVFFIRMDTKELEHREFNSEFRTADSDYIKKTEDIFHETIEKDNLRVIELWNNSTIDEGAHKLIKAITEFKASLESSVPEQDSEPVIPVSEES